MKWFGLIFVNVIFLPQILVAQTFSAENLKVPGAQQMGESFLFRNPNTEPDTRIKRTSLRADNTHLQLPSNYDQEIPPSQINGSGIPVKFSVLIFSVRGISEIAQEIQIEMRLQMWWPDERLDAWKNKTPPAPPGKNTFISITHKMDTKLWHPDIFIDFVKEIEQPTLLGATPISLRYYSNGYLRISARVTIRMACPMDFHYYPVDKQECNVIMKSYAHPNDVLAIQWNSGDTNRLSFVKPGMDPPNFRLGLNNPAPADIKTGSDNYYSGIKFTVLLKRQLSYHFIQTYIPSSLFVMISWLSFFVPPESVPGRMAICMTTLLSQTTMFSAIRQNIPKVSYPKALDIWMVACIFFVFVTLFEYTLILKLRSLIAAEEAKLVRKASAASQAGIPPELNEKTTTFNSGRAGCLPIGPNKYTEAVNFLEKYTWFCCIALFVLFNVVYWPWLFVSSDYYSKFGEALYYDATSKN